MKVFADADEIEEFKKMAAEAQATPVMSFSSRGPSFAEQARQHMMKKVYASALKHGLPEIQGYYGLDFKTGEFLKTE